jgi:hypothetical protein
LNYFIPEKLLQSLKKIWVGSEIHKKLIPDPRAKKALDPGCGTLKKRPLF